jgi:hypothetical protein
VQQRHESDAAALGDVAYRRCVLARFGARRLAEAARLDGRLGFPTDTALVKGAEDALVLF